MSILVQDLVVSFVALGAAVTIVYRGLSMFTSDPAAPGCSSCDGCSSNRTVPRDALSGDRRIIRPLVLPAPHARHR